MGLMRNLVVSEPKCKHDAAALLSVRVLGRVWRFEMIEVKVNAASRR